jgi:hypothetical protein
VYYTIPIQAWQPWANTHQANHSRGSRTTAAPIRHLTPIQRIAVALRGCRRNHGLSSSHSSLLALTWCLRLMLLTLYLPCTALLLPLLLLLQLIPAWRLCFPRQLNALVLSLLPLVALWLLGPCRGLCCCRWLRQALRCAALRLLGRARVLCDDAILEWLCVAACRCCAHTDALQPTQDLSNAGPAVQGNSSSSRRSHVILRTLPV